MFWKDRLSRHLGCNLVVARALGYDTPDRVVGRTDPDLPGVSPDQAAGFVAVDQEVMLSGVPRLRVTERLTRADGREAWLETSKFPLRDAGGDIVGVIGTWEDVTDRRRMELTLRESEARYRELFEANPHPMWAYDRETLAFLAVNDAAVTKYGYARDEFLRMTIADIRPPGDVPAMVANVAAVTEGFNDAGVWRHRLRDGRLIRVRVTSHTLTFADRPAEVVLAQDVTAQLAAEESLRASEERLRLFVEHAPVALAMFDREMRYLVASRRWRDDYRLGDGALTGRSHYDLFPELPDRWRAVHRRALAGEVLRAEEDRYDRPDGGAQWLRWEVRPWAAPDGAVGGVVIFAEDITDRKQAAERLSASEERYRRLVEVLPVAVLINAGDRVAYCNPACVQLFGAADAAALVGKSPFDLFAPEYHEAIRGRIRQMRETGAPVSGLEERVVRCDGRVAPVLVVATPITDGGRPAILVCLRDLSERERAMDLLRTVLGSVADAILTIDARGTVTSANPATERLFGYAPAELLGGNVSALMPEPHRSGHDRYVADYLRTGAAKVIGVGREVEGRRKDGSTFPAELTVTEFRLDGARHFTGVVRDITARRRLEEQFRQAQKMEAVGRLAGGVAHDFNNLLTVINGYADLLLAGRPAGDPAREPLAAVLDAGERAARLTHQLLAFSRRSPVEPGLVDLSELVAGSAKLLRRLIGEDVALSVLADPSPVRVVADPGQLEQVLMNLAVNARDAMPSGGRLTIETRAVELAPGAGRPHPELPPGRYAELRVADTGFGMPEDVRAKIFEPFFTTKGVGKGTGLGLAVVHGVVKQAGGSVAVESAVGAGTTFTVLLPPASVPDGPAVPAAAELAPRGVETVLLVEDEDAVRGLARVVLEAQGYTVLAAAGGAEAREVLRAYAGPVDLLVTDVVMPGASGREVAEAARAARPGLRVLYMSGYTDDALGRHGLGGAGDPLIRKPFTPLALARRVRALLDHGG